MPLQSCTPCHHPECPRRPAAGRQVLTIRQREVIALLRRGKNCKQAALVLGISRGAVNQYLFQARRRLGCDTNAHLVDETISRGLI